MGDMADMMIEGVLCEECGSLIDRDAPGYPRSCEDCREERRKSLKRSRDKKPKPRDTKE
jgi:hypothetical protein